MYTQILASMYLFWLYLLPVLIRRWDRIKVTISAAVVALVLYLPWLTLLPAQLSRIQGGYWIERPGALELIQTLISFNAGLPLQGLWLPVGLALSILFVFLLVWQTYRSRATGTAHSHRLMALTALSLFPIALLFIISQVWPVYVIRGLLPSGVIYLLWIAMVLTGKHIKAFDRWVMGAVLIVLFAVGLFNHFTYNGFPYAPFEEINDYLEAELEDGGIVIHSNKLTMLPAYYYDPQLPHEFLPDIPGSNSDTLAVPTQEVIGIRSQPGIEAAAGDHRQIFFVIFTRELSDYQQVGIELPPALRYLIENYEEVSTRSFGDVLIYKFQAPAYIPDSG
jgi:hypothetical protein